MHRKRKQQERWLDVVTCLFPAKRWKFCSRTAQIRSGALPLQGAAVRRLELDGSVHEAGRGEAFGAASHDGYPYLRGIADK